ncbi:MAG: transcription termination/antitermination NusG family protein [Mesorhizobium sp.]
MSELPDLNCSKKWYVVATKPRKEAVAALNLKNQGFCIFLPQMRRTVRHARRTLVRTIPLFPTYLFLEASSAGRWRSVNGTFGAKRIIASDDGPLAVERGFVEALKTKVGADGIIDFSSGFKRGDCVELVDGPFARQIGSLVDLDDRGRVTVLMKFLATHVPVRTTVDKLAPA